METVMMTCWRPLVSCATPEVYEYFDHCETYQEAEATLEQLYVKKPNDIFARHLLSIEKQKPIQTLKDFRCNLVKLAKDCDFKDVTAMQYREDMIRDAFSTITCLYPGVGNMRYCQDQ